MNYNDLMGSILKESVVAIIFIIAILMFFKQQKKNGDSTRYAMDCRNCDLKRVVENNTEVMTSIKEMIRVQDTKVDQLVRYAERADKPREG